MSTSLRQSHGTHGPRRLGHVCGCSLGFAFTNHSRERLSERFGLGVRDVLRSLPDGRVVARNRSGYYVTELAGDRLGDTRMLAVLAYPNHQDQSSVAVVTVYPAWDGDARSAHLDIAAKYGCQMVRKRPVLEVLNDDSTI